MNTLKNELAKIALANMLLLGMLTPKTPDEMIEISMKGKYAEEDVRRAIAEGRLNLYEVRKEIDELLKPLVLIESMRVKPVICHIDEHGQIKRKEEYDAAVEPKPKKYAMVLIAPKRTEDGTNLYRRVLISYEDEIVDSENYRIFFDKTRFIDKDDYFKTGKANLKYEFLDDGFILKSIAESHKEGHEDLIGTKRRYHENCSYFETRALRFEADSDEDAIRIFHERTERR